MSIERKKYCVNGAWTESKTEKWLPVTDSSTGEVIAEVPSCTQEEVLEAIRAHTTGRPGMGPLALVLYVADKIEPARDYPSVGRLRTLARLDLNGAAAESLRRAHDVLEADARPA